MTPIRVVAIPTAIAHAVRTTNKDPRYGYPAHVELARGHGPCRHCLQAFSIGKGEAHAVHLRQPTVIEELFSRPEVVYIHVRVVR